MTPSQCGQTTCSASLITAPPVQWQPLQHGGATAVLQGTFHLCRRRIIRRALCSALIAVTAALLWMRNSCCVLGCRDGDQRVRDAARSSPSMNSMARQPSRSSIVHECSIDCASRPSGWRLPLLSVAVKTWGFMVLPCQTNFLAEAESFSRQDDRQNISLAHRTSRAVGQSID